MLTRPKQRINSIDILRGAVMLIMAIDHVREYFHNTALTQDPTDLATTTPALFLTRWITHFCAPVFVFLSGTSAFLAGRNRTISQTSLFLLKRGVWLVVVELVIITFGLTLNPLYNLFILQVIWAIGWSMIILGALLFAGTRTIVVAGALLVLAHNLLDPVRVSQSSAGGILLDVFLTSPGRFYPIGAAHAVLDAYAILPWTGIMLLGYVFGKVYNIEEGQKRRRRLLQLGAGVCLLFAVLRLIDQYGDPARWSVQKNAVLTVLSFLRVTKYPASLIYTCMTIGPALIVLSLLEHARSWFSRVLGVYGRVPFFYYVCHFYLIQAFVVIAFFATGHTSKQIGDPKLPFLFHPPGSGFSLGVVYLVWFTVIFLLYWPCRWFDRYRSQHRQWWLSYL